MSQMVKKWICLIVVLAAVCTSTPFAYAADNQSFSCEDYHFVLDSNGNAVITQYTGSGKYLEIPEVLNGKTVIGIGNVAFYGSSLVRVSLPAGITSITGNPFGGCVTLESITVDGENPVYADIKGVLFEKAPKKLISYPAGSQLTHYTVPEGVREIGNAAFWGCTNLTSVTLPGSLSSAAAYAFEDCGSLTLVVPRNSYAAAYASGIGLPHIYEDMEIQETEPTDPPLRIGDSLFFGKTEQDNNYGNGKENIEWIVLDQDGDKYLVISKYCIGVGSYHSRLVSITWENSAMRSWLNGTFLNESFTEEERTRIQPTLLDNPDNPEYGTYGGRSTEDKVFLLSIQEANRYFRSDFDMMTSGTANAKAHNIQVNGGNGQSWWWLRSPAIDSQNGSYVRTTGGTSTYGVKVTFVSGGIRPAMWITLK